MCETLEHPQVVVAMGNPGFYPLQILSDNGIEGLGTACKFSHLLDVSLGRHPPGIR